MLLRHGSHRRPSLSVAASLVVALLLSSTRAASSSSSRRVRAARDDAASFPRNGPDRWVAASPVAVAAVCSDGVALVAVHDGPRDEPLSVPLDDDDDDDVVVRALPHRHRGPARLERVDGVGTTLVAAGWRADRAILARLCRDRAAEDSARYGPSVDVDGEEAAEAAADALARFAQSTGTRTLACAGLLASANGAEGGGALWAVDATGAWRVRALAIGVGARRVNRELTRTDFASSTKEEGVGLLLRVLLSSTSAAAKKNSPRPLWVEAAVVDAETRTMRRIRDVGPLLGNEMKSTEST